MAQISEMSGSQEELLLCIRNARRKYWLLSGASFSCGLAYSLTSLKIQSICIMVLILVYNS